MSAAVRSDWPPLEKRTFYVFTPFTQGMTDQTRVRRGAGHMCFFTREGGGGGGAGQRCRGARIGNESRISSLPPSPKCRLLPPRPPTLPAILATRSRAACPSAPSTPDLCASRWCGPRRRDSPTRWRSSKHARGWQRLAEGAGNGGRGRDGALARCETCQVSHYYSSWLSAAVPLDPPPLCMCCSLINLSRKVVPAGFQHTFGVQVSP